MGGFASSILEKIGEKTEGLLEKTTFKTADYSLGRLAQDTGGNKEWLLDLTPEGKAIAKMTAEYHRVRTSALGESNKNVKAVIDWHQGNDAIRNQYPLKTATLGELHQAAQASN